MGPPGKTSATLNALGCRQFAQMIEKAGITSFIDGLILSLRLGLSGVTIFAPIDSAYTAISNSLSNLSPAMLRAYIFYHIIPQMILTTNFPAGSFKTLLANNTMNITVNNEGVMLPGATTWIFDQADNFVQGGSIQRIAFFMNPSNLPDVSDPVSPANVPSGSASYTIQGPSTVSITTYANGKPTGSSQSNRGNRHELAVGGLAAAVGMLAMVVL